MASSQRDVRRVAELEARSDPRVAIELRAELCSDQFSGPLAVFTRDLSIGGACVATRSPVALSSLRELAIQLTSGQLRVPVQGRWEHWNPAMGVNLVGVAFASVTPEKQDALWDQVLDASKDLARFLLRRSDLRDVGIDGAMSLAQASRLCLVGAGAAVFRQGADAGSPQNSFFILREGSVVLRTRVRDAIERDIALVQPGQLLGGLPMIAPVNHHESAIARAPSKLLEIDERAFLYLMQSRPWVAQKLAFAAARAYAQRMHATLETIGAQDRLAL